MINFENKKKLVTAAIACAIFFTVFYFITNVEAVSTFFSGILAVLSPIIIGAAIAYLLNPLLKIFEFKVFKKMNKKSLRRTLSLLLTYVVAILVIVAILFLIIPQLVKSITDLTSKFSSYMDSTAAFINSVIEKFADESAEEATFDAEQLKKSAISFITSSGNLLSSIGTYAVDFAMGLVIGVKNFLVGLFISIYILIFKENLQAQTRRMSAAIFKSQHNKRIFRYMRMANKSFGNFFIGKIIDSLIIGVITFIALIVLKIPYAILVATIVTITNVIPFFGPIIGAIPSAFIIFIAEPKKALVFLVLILVIQLLDGNVIGPAILGESTGISPLGVIIAVTIMGEYFGVVGMIIAVPIFATASIIINELIEAKLKSKNMPHELAHYYDRNSLVDPHEDAQKTTTTAFAFITKHFKKKSAEAPCAKAEPATEAAKATAAESAEPDTTAAEATEKNTDEA